MFRRQRRTEPVPPIAIDVVHAARIDGFSMISPNSGTLKSHALRVGTLFKRPVESARLYRDDKVVRHTLVSLLNELQAEQLRHAATAACLRQEQEMLALLGTQLAAAETSAASQSASLTDMKKQLELKECLHDASIQALLEQRRINQHLAKQMANLQGSGAKAGGLKQRLAVQATCLAVGVAAAAKLPFSTLPPSLQSLSGPVLTALLAARATATALHALGLLCRKACSQHSRWQQKAAAAAAALSVSAQPPSIQDSTAPGTVQSWNCWEQDGLCLQDADSSGEANTGGDGAVLAIPYKPTASEMFISRLGWPHRKRAALVTL